MPLVKASKIGANGAKRAPEPATPEVPANRPRKPARRGARASHTREAIAERIAAATQELASGLSEAAAATRELERAMTQIAAGAEEAAGAAEEQSAATKQIGTDFARARTQADAGVRRSEAVASTLTEATSQITESVRAIERNAERQLQSITVISEVERRALEIGEITEMVSRIADRTNLLALNAAIEAARAGDQGRGFAVVADEVRTLAETSDKNALEVRRLTTSVQKDLGGIVLALKSGADTAAVEARDAAGVIDDLAARRADIAKIAEGSRDVLRASMESETAATQALRGAEQVATAAEEQAGGASEAQTAILQQAQSLDQAHAAAQELATSAEHLRAGKVSAASTEQISTAAEELSATIQQLSSAASQVMKAVDQINRAAQLQAGATQEASAALAQIESGAKLAQQNGRTADDRVQAIGAALLSGRKSVEALIRGAAAALDGMRTSAATISGVEAIGRKIEKIVDAIALVAVQTGMLAVSGSVEAARAGDAGRGFAVVSNDIRSLAREAAENIDRAKDTVRGIVDQVAVLKRDLELMISSSEAAAHSGRAVVDLLQQIAAEVESLGTASKAILAGADSILSAASESATGARQIASAAEEASSASRQASTAAAEQLRSADSLAAAIEEIASLTDELRRKDG